MIALIALTATVHRQRVRRLRRDSRTGRPYLPGLGGMASAPDPPPTTPAEETAADLAATGAGATTHPVEHARPYLERRRALTAAAVRGLRPDPGAVRRDRPRIPAGGIPCGWTGFSRSGDAPRTAMPPPAEHTWSSTLLVLVGVRLVLGAKKRGTCASPRRWGGLLAQVPGRECRGLQPHFGTTGVRLCGLDLGDVVGDQVVHLAGQFGVFGQDVVGVVDALELAVLQQSARGAQLLGVVHALVAQ